MSGPLSAELTLLYDGGCPLCVREVTFLRRRDQRRHGSGCRLAFVDINAADYNADQHGGIRYREAMGRIHALRADGAVLQDVAVFREAYRLVGLGWLYAPTAWPVLGSLCDALYGLWAHWRLAITGRPNRVLAIVGGDAVVATGKSPEGRPVPIAWVQRAMDQLAKDGEITIDVEPCKRYYINNQYRDLIQPEFTPVVDYVEVIIGCTVPGK